MLRNYLNLDFPLHVSDASGDINYYVDFTGMDVADYFHLTFDEDKIPLRKYKSPIGVQRNYLFVAIWGIFCLQSYLKNKSEKWLRKTYKQADWLIKNVSRDNKRGCFWAHDYPWVEDGILLTPPWISAMGHGMALSLLSRVYRLKNDERYIEDFENILNLFETEVRDGGVKSKREGLVFYEEYHGTNDSVRILDGFLVALLGLYDAFKYTNSSRAKILFDEGINTLTRQISIWNFNNLWSWYYPGKKLSDRMYNKFNFCLLLSLYDITREEAFKGAADRWSPHDKTMREKMSIYRMWFFWRLKQSLQFDLINNREKSLC